ncbi:hypothetical protein L7F22_054924, partial [Adiantum nelumboides]|nr:hypothetical protein [Adiantum nelumboides]
MSNHLLTHEHLHGLRERILNISLDTFVAWIYRLEWDFKALDSLGEFTRRKNGGDQ